MVLLFNCRSMNWKKFSFGGLWGLVVVLAAATFVEKSFGTDFVVRYVYHSWWFVLLWGWVAFSGFAALLRHKFRGALIALHASLLLILLGALLTFLTARRGVVHLRQGVPADSFQEETLHGKVTARLPFTMRLEQFSVRYHPGSEMPADYETSFTIQEEQTDTPVFGTVSMNRIFSYRGIRFYQTSYDADGKGSYLSLNEDRYGIPVTYAGYFLLFVSLIWMLCDRKGSFRTLWRNPRLHRLMMLCCLLVPALEVCALPTLREDRAQEFGQLLVSYQGRVCPMQTLALDLVRKLHGSDRYQHYSAEQVMAGLLFYAAEWDAEPLVRVKDAGLRQALQCGKYVSVNQLVQRDVSKDILGDVSGNVSEGSYVLQPYVEAYYQGKHSKLNKAAVELDERLQLLALLRQGSMMRVFPMAQSGDLSKSQSVEQPEDMVERMSVGWTFGLSCERTCGEIRWYSPVDSLPAATPRAQQLFVREAFSWLYEYGVRGGDDAVLRDMLSKIKNYQKQYGGNSVPDPFRLRAEHWYNRFPVVGMLYKINLTVGLVLFLTLIFSLLKNRPLPYVCNPWMRSGVWVLLGGVFALLTVHIALRWVICGRLPMGNGYETMLLLAWLVLLLALLLYRIFPVLVSFGFLLSGFFLLVSGLSQMDPVMTHLVPVLSSPLLSIHVSLIMSAYALLSFTALCALVSLLLFALRWGKTVGGALTVRDSSGECSLYSRLLSLWRAAFRSGPIHLSGEGDLSECRLSDEGRMPDVRLPEWRLVERQESLLLLSRLFLYPGIALLAAGIFVGAIWANVSWGRYWGWDPKEVWALINLLLYAVPLHGFRFFRSPVRYHFYMLFCFLTVLMTYIGVNYFLGGMHSYA